ncbi:MAG TPA: carboxylating nicotinate-nucleotide diphosphorylase [Solirubrobacterales bacterium]|nr:carboxylating nicotinate-nucleotide diphosphorylase [Solirubrobacterales bacterium]
MTDDLAILVARALAEDVGSGDITAEAVVPADARTTARIVQKGPGVIFGFAAAAEVFEQAGAERFESLVGEGTRSDEVPRDIARVSGPARAILTGERTALNFLAHLSGVATLTAQFVEAAKSGGAEILDTRKTSPGLRGLEKAAVAAGGGRNHRMGLHDAILIKENHAELAGGITEAIKRARDAQPDKPIEVEVRNTEEVQAALEAGAERLLLDNMTISGLRSAVAARDAAAKAGASVAALEASGGVSLATTPEIASTGVDFISVGALTHSAPAIDLSLLIDRE